MKAEKVQPKTQVAGKKRYTKKDKLSDVIRLISMLSQGKYAFHSEDGIKNALRGNPLSAASWEEIARDHPEFFRPQGAGTMFALLIRSYFEKDDNEIRVELTVEQTQKLIDVAIALHDKEIQRRQMYSFRYPLWIALLALAGTVSVPIVTARLHKDNDKIIDRIDSTAQRIETMLKTSPAQGDPKDSLPTKKAP